MFSGPAKAASSLACLRYFCSRINPITGLVTLKTPFRFVSRTSSQSFSLIMAASLSRVIPALLTRMSTVPHFSFNCFPSSFA